VGLISLLRRSLGQSWHVVAGCIVVITGFELVLVAQAASIETSQAFGRIAELMPAYLQRGLGQQALLLATFNGTVAFGYFHPVVVLFSSLLGVYFATEPAYDVETGRVDLVLARAVPRRRMITRSLLLALAAVVVLVAMMGAGTWLGLHVFAAALPVWPSPRAIARLMIHLVAVAWCCAAFGLVVASGSSRWTTAFAASALTTIVMYFLDFLAIAWPRARPIAWLSPFDYYPAIPILGGTAPAFRNLVVLWTATAVLSLIAYWRFERRDL
jgi:beta-exotoxin I transport system permease protein